MKEEEKKKKKKKKMMRKKKKSTPKTRQDKRPGGVDKTTAGARAQAFISYSDSNSHLSGLCTAALFELLPISNKRSGDLFRDIIQNFLDAYRQHTPLWVASTIIDVNGHTFLWHAVDMGDGTKPANYC